MKQQIEVMSKVQAELVRIVDKALSEKQENKENISMGSPKETIERGVLSPNLSDWVLERINSHRL